MLLHVFKLMLLINSRVGYAGFVGLQILPQVPNHIY